MNLGGQVLAWLENYAEFVANDVVILDFCKGGFDGSGILQVCLVFVHARVRVVGLSISPGCAHDTHQLIF